MVHATSAKVTRMLRVALALVALSAIISVRAAEQPSADDLGALRRSVESRFDVVPLTRGIALAGRTADRSVEIAGGVVSSRGVALTGEDLRRRFGADADLVLKLSYLSDADLRRLFTDSAPPAAPEPPVAPRAATPPAPPRAPAPPVASSPELDAARPSTEVPPAEPPRRRTGARLAVAKPMTIEADEDVRDGVFSLGGDVTIHGRVRDEVVVVGGRLELTPTAEVRGDITVVGGELVMADGARHSGRVHRVSETMWPRWSGPGIDWGWFEPRGAARWLGAAGSMARITLLAFAVAALTFLATGRVTRIGAAAGAAPLRAAGIGLATQLLFVPLLVIAVLMLAITIIGIPFAALLVPGAVVTLLVAMLVGFTGVVLRLGGTVAERLGWRTPSPVLAALLGLAIVVLPTLVFQALALTPVPWPARLPLALASLLEYLAWTIGLGAAVRTAFGRWAVLPPPVPPPPYDSLANAPSPL